MIPSESQSLCDLGELEIELDRLNELSQIASIEKMCAENNFQRLESGLMSLIKDINIELVRLEKPEHHITVVRLDSSCIHDGIAEPYVYTENEHKVRIRRLKSKRRKLNHELKLLKQAYMNQSDGICWKERDYARKIAEIRSSIDRLAPRDGAFKSGYRKEKAILARIVEKIQAVFG